MCLQGFRSAADAFWKIQDGQLQLMTPVCIDLLIV
jgi:hypothetical protein